MFKTNMKMAVKKQMEHRCIIYPENELKAHWDIFISLVLIFTCIVTPYRIALVENDTVGWTVSNYTIDGFFVIDMIIIFNTAYYDEDFAIIEDRCSIAKEYLWSWFFIDLICVIPFEVFLASNATDMVRLSRLGRLYKILKLMKLLRLAKLQKQKSQSLMANV